MIELQIRFNKVELAIEQPCPVSCAYHLVLEFVKIQMKGQWVDKLIFLVETCLLA